MNTIGDEKGKFFWKDERKAIEYAIVSLMQEGTPISQMESDSNGKVIFYNFPSEKYEIK